MIKLDQQSLQTAERIEQEAADYRRSILNVSRRLIALEAVVEIDPSALTNCRRVGNGSQMSERICDGG